MPFKALLMELVSSVDGAEGAIFLDKEGEGVQWYAKDAGERLQLRAAYLAVVLGACGALAARLGVGQTRRLVLEYEGARFIIEQLEAGYFVVLELNPSANLGQAIYRIQPTVARIREELGT